MLRLIEKVRESQGHLISQLSDIVGADPIPFRADGSAAPDSSHAYANVAAARRSPGFAGASRLGGVWCCLLFEMGSFVIPVFRRIFAYFCVFSRVALPRRAIGISCVFGRVGTSCAEYSIQKYYYGIFCIHSVLVRGYSVLGDTLRILQNTPKHVVSSSRI